MNCNTKKLRSIENCGNIKTVESTYHFINGECFRDGIKFGKIILSNERLLRVEIDNGNKYMTGHIVDFTINK